MNWLTDYNNTINSIKMYFNDISYFIHQGVMKIAMKLSNYSEFWIGITLSSEIEWLR